MGAKVGPVRRLLVRCRWRTLVSAGAVAAALAAGAQALAGPGSGLLGPGLDNADWTMIGHDPSNSRDQPNEQAIDPSNVDALVPKWVAPTTGDVSATPAVAGGAVYFPDWGGTLWKLDAATGAVTWSNKVSTYTGITGDVSRTSPTLDGNTLIIGDLSAPNIIGINATTGAAEWVTRLDPDPHAIITGSPVLVGDTIYVGTSQSGTSTYPGAIAALNALTGQLLWRTYSLPNPNGTPGGYWGAVMFGSPTVDVEDGLVFAAFKVAQAEPPSVAACNAQATGGFSESCEQPGSYLSSLVALNMATGAPVWSYRVVGPAPWQRACGSQPAAVTWCGAEGDHPLNGGDKWDLGGSSPNLFQVGSRTVIGVGEKSGVYVALDAKTGQFLWNTLVGPGGDQGGMEWGTAFDGNRIYTSITNQHHIPYNMTENGALTGTVATGGSWAALDPSTGEILWQTPDPQTESVPGFTNVGVWDLGPVSTANGVVYASSMAKTGNEMYALDAATGKILWSFSAGSAVNAGPAIVGDTVYWGSGYARSGVEGSGNTKLFAFTLRPPGNVICADQALTGLVQGSLTVPRGDWCDLTNNVHVTGDLRLEGSSGIRLVGAEIDGNLEAENVTDTADPSSPGVDVICNTTVKGQVEVHGSSASAVWNVGGGTGCADTVGGKLEFQNNGATGDTIANTSVGGDLHVHNNGGTTTVSGNTVGGSLECKANGAIAGGGNVVQGSIRGQCTGTRV